MSNIQAVVFDRDGTLIELVSYLSDVKDIRILPTVCEALLLLKEHSIQCFVATNQSGIGRGFYTESQYKIIEAYLDRLFTEYGIDIKKTYYCPFHPDHGVGHYKRVSNDRKPNPGMIQRVISDFDLQPEQVVMIGDNKVDIDAAKNAGVRSVLVTTGMGQTFVDDDSIKPDFIAQSLLSAVTDYILTL